MLKLTLFELFFRLLPEGFLFCALLYVLSNKRIKGGKFFITGTILGVTPFIIRYLPISFGVHTILSLIIYIIVAVSINNIDIIKSISSGLLSIVILSICEFINFVVVVHLLNVEVDLILDNVVMKTLMGLPSLIMFGLIIIIIQKTKANKYKDVVKAV